MKGFQNETIAIIKINNHNNQKVFIIIKSLFIKLITKIKLLMIKSIIIMRINSNIIINMNYKVLIKTSRLKKVSLMITTTKKFNFIMKSISISSIFILFIIIVIRFSNQNRNYISIYKKVTYQTL